MRRPWSARARVSATGTGPPVIMFETSESIVVALKLIPTPNQSVFQIEKKRRPACSERRSKRGVVGRQSGGAGRAVGGGQLEGGETRANLVDIGGAELRQRRGVIGEPCADLAAERSEPARGWSAQIEPTDGAGAERDGQGLPVGVEAEKAHRGVERNRGQQRAFAPLLTADTKHPQHAVVAEGGERRAVWRKAQVGDAASRWPIHVE